MYEALKQFRMQWRYIDTETPTRFVSRLVELGLEDKALEFLKVNPTYRAFPNRSTYRALLNHFKRAGDGETAYKVWRLWTSFDEMRPKASDYYTIIKALLKTSEFDKAEKIWDEIQ